MEKEGTKAYALAFKKCFKNVKKTIQSLVQQIHFCELLQTGVMQKSRSSLGEAIGKEANAKLLRGCKIYWARSWQRVRDHIAHSLINPVKRHCLVNIHIYEVGRSNGHNVINGFKVLCDDDPAVSLAGVVKGFTVEDAKFIDTHCNWSAAQNWASWWLRPSHLQM